MTIHPTIRDQAYQFFVEEAPELLQILESGLLTLSQKRTPQTLHELMRAAHSIKGSAASVGLDAVKDIAHRLETIFKALYNDSIDLDTELETALLHAYDCLKAPLMEQIITGSHEAEEAIATADPIFQWIEERLGDALARADDFIPSSSDLGVDMVASIFEVDIAQGLERLEQVCLSPEQYELLGEVEAQVEVFAGIAELTNLQGFGLIAQTTREALTAHPNRVLEIARLALADFQAAREQVLAGKRTDEGQPSEELLAIAHSTSELFASFETSEASEVSESLATDPSALELALAELFEEAIAPGELETPPSEPELIAAEPLTANVEDLQWVVAPEDNASAPEEDPQDFTRVIQTIHQVFAELPLVAPEAPTPAALETIPIATETITVEPTVPAAPPIRSEPVSTSLKPTEKDIPSAPTLSVRVDLERLERMNNQVGELAINRNGLSLQHEQLQRSARNLMQRFSQFQSIVTQLREVSDKMLVKPSRYSAAVRSQAEYTTSSGGLSLFHGKFDALEMDQYTALHSHLQSILEEVVQLEESVGDIMLFTGQANQTLQQQRQMLNQLRDELVWARMLPLGEVLNRFPRVLRDLGAQHQKLVNLKLIGTSVLVDKAVLEKLYDPLLQILRNAFDHGIETPEQRQQQGKSPHGLIEIRAHHQGNKTLIEVKDDGRGINLADLRRRAVDIGLMTPEQATHATPEQLLDLIFEPGFSTAAQVSDLSGRGVGLDIARSRLRSLQGTITVHSVPNQGTTVTLCLPLTLTIAKLLVCSVGATALAFPSDGIEEIVVPKPEYIHQSGNQRFLHWRDCIVPVHRLVDLLHYACPVPETSLSKALATAPMPREWALPLLIMRREQQFVALEINRLVTEQELVIKPFSTAIAPPSYAYGCTILGDGTLIPVIDGRRLTESALDEPKAPQPTLDLNHPIDLVVREAVPVAPPVSPPMGSGSWQAPVILVVDDAATLRRTLTVTLQRAGYRVLQARDGREAIEQLERSQHVHMVICDIEMPNMNGFEFLNYRRQRTELSHIPVVMLTSRSSDKHRKLALHLGANDYFTKPYTEQEFMVAIQTLLHQAQSLVHGAC